MFEAEKLLLLNNYKRNKKIMRIKNRCATCEKKFNCELRDEFLLECLDGRDDVFDCTLMCEKEYWDLW